MLKIPFLSIYQVLTVFILKILVLLVDICNIFKELSRYRFFDCGCKGKNFYFNLPNFFGSFFVFSSAFGILKIPTP